MDSLSQTSKKDQNQSDRCFPVLYLHINPSCGKLSYGAIPIVW